MTTKMNFKKIFMLILIVIAIFSLRYCVQAEYKPLTRNTIVSTKCNAYIVTGKIVNIRNTKKGNKRVSVKCNSDYGKRYDGHIFSVVVSKRDFRMWKEEQGKIGVKTKVTLLMYDCYTRTLKDDVLVNIRKGWY